MLAIGYVMTEAEVRVMPLLKGDHYPRNVGGLYKLEKARSGFFPETFRKNKHCQHLDFTPVRPILDFEPPELYDSKFVLHHLLQQQ